MGVFQGKEVGVGKGGEEVVMENRNGKSEEVGIFRLEKIFLWDQKRCRG